MVHRMTFCLMLCGSFYLTSGAVADDGSQPEITVTGTAVTCVTPDEIVWSITTTDDDPDLEKAKKASDESAARVMAIRDKLKIAPDQLTSGRLQIEKVYDRDRNRVETTFKHFRVRRQFSIKQKDLDRFDEYLSEIVGGPVEGSFRYETSRRYEIRNETRIKAVKLAKQKAAAMAEALGVAIGEPLKIMEITGGWGAAANNFAYNEVQMDAADQTDGQMVPDAIEIKISVQVVFALKSLK